MARSKAGPSKGTPRRPPKDPYESSDLSDLPSPSPSDEEHADDVEMKEAHDKDSDYLDTASASDPSEVEDDSDDGDYRIGAKPARSRKPARKRTRVSATAAGASKPRKSTGTPGKLVGNRGKLRGIINLPIETIGEVMTYLDPTDLLRLSRTNRFFRTILTRRSSSYIWQSARRNVPESLPDLPRDMSEPAFAALVFEKSCQNCGRKGCQTALWKWRARLCKSCQNVEFLTRPQMESDYPDVKSFAIAHPRSWYKYFRPSMDMLQRAWDEKSVELDEEEEKAKAKGEGMGEGEGEKGEERGEGKNGEGKMRAEGEGEMKGEREGSAEVKLEGEGGGVPGKMEGVEEAGDRQEDGAQTVAEQAQMDEGTGQAQNEQAPAQAEAPAGGAASSTNEAGASADKAAEDATKTAEKAPMADRSIEMNKHMQALVREINSFNAEMISWEGRTMTLAWMKQDEVGTQRRKAIADNLVDEGYSRSDFEGAHWFKDNRHVSKRQALTPRIWNTIRDQVKALVDEHIEAKREWRAERLRWRHRLDLKDKFEAWAKKRPWEESRYFPQLGEFWRLPSVYEICDDVETKITQTRWRDLLPRLSEDLSRYRELFERALLRKVHRVDAMRAIAPASSTFVSPSALKTKGKAPATAEQVERDAELDDAERRRKRLQAPDVWFTCSRPNANQDPYAYERHPDVLLAYPPAMRHICGGRDNKPPVGLSPNYLATLDTDSPPAPTKMKPLEMTDEAADRWETVQHLSFSEKAKTAVQKLVERASGKEEAAKIEKGKGKGKGEGGEGGEGGSKTREALDKLGCIFECRLGKGPGSTSWAKPCDLVSGRQRFSAMVAHVMSEHVDGLARVAEGVWIWLDPRRPTIVDEIRLRSPGFEASARMAGCGVCKQGRNETKTVVQIRDHLRNEHGLDVGEDNYESIELFQPRIREILAGSVGYPRNGHGYGAGNQDHDDDLDASELEDLMDFGMFDGGLFGYPYLDYSDYSDDYY